MMLIGAHHALPKFTLMQALPKQSRRISPPDIRLLRFNLTDGSQARKPPVVHTYGERQAGGIVANDVDGPLGDIEAGHNAVEVNERHFPLHRDP